MNKNCIIGNESYSGYEDGVEVAYLKLFFDPWKCSQCKWKDGWTKEYWKGQHPCRLIMVNHPNYFESAIETVGDDFLSLHQVWSVTFRFAMSELADFANTLPLMSEERMLTSG